MPFGRKNSKDKSKAKLKDHPEPVLNVNLPDVHSPREVGGIRNESGLEGVSEHPLLSPNRIPTLESYIEPSQDKVGGTAPQLEKLSQREAGIQSLKTKVDELTEENITLCSHLKTTPSSSDDPSLHINSEAYRLLLQEKLAKDKELEVLKTHLADQHMLHQKLEEKSHELGERKTELEQKCDELKDKSQEIGTLQRRLEHVDKLNYRLREHVKTLTVATPVPDQLVEMPKTNEQQRLHILELEQKIGDLELGDESLRVEIKKGQAHIDKLTRDHIGVVDHSKRQSKKVLEYKDRQKILEEQQKELEAELEFATKQNNVLLADKSQLDGAFWKLCADRAKLETEVKTLRDKGQKFARTELKEMEKACKESQEKISRLQTDLTRVSTERNDCLDEIQELGQHYRNRTAAQQTTLVNLQQKLADSGRKVVQLTSGMNMQQVEILHLTEQRDEVCKELGTHKMIVTLSRAQRIQRDLDFKLKQTQAQLPQRQPVSPVYNERALDRYVVRPRRPIKFDKKIGEGCYGSVYAINLDGTPCIAKRLQDILMGRNREEAVSQQTKETFHQNFFRECVLLSQTDHPNIVKFIGVHYGLDKFDLTLILEQLATDLQRFLKKDANIPLSAKISVLHDVSCGLLCLHESSIIHRDLSAANILLTADVPMRAKITDLGVSRIFNRSLSQLTNAPGSQAYMSPEALQNEKYDESLDIFSFGVVALYAAVQEFPQFSWSHVPDAIMAKGEGEIYKRRSWIDKMNTKQPELSSIVLWCLQDDPMKRPSTFCLNILLNEMRSDYPFSM